MASGFPKIQLGVTTGTPSQWRQLVADRRFMNPQAFAHLRLELGLDEPEPSAAE